ncbi:cf5cfd0c-4526-4063-9946-97da0b0c6349 [Thermothielavioides terrestris]|uniref:Cf5cfd0c-4526-4063-9946-97da0b0c6349 n=1 Tax=Thermothielavioides terrestris TaxID=2587410 RepID=A0A3S5CWE1_9PEZI|nr:cf5cfd0c-4526-4063-9946-97da0b0c6349 [Thermothielavioides terrestris]
MAVTMAVSLTAHIELVHEIVVLAESIYPTLPERDRLPTNALFLAAEQILPQHGLDPENGPSHISRLIFKIGGQRSGNTINDKFNAVLGGMAIPESEKDLPDEDLFELEYMMDCPFHPYKDPLIWWAQQEDRELVKDVFGSWHATACEAKRRNDELKSQAVEYDNNDLLGEVLDIWNEEAAAAQEQRLKAEAAAQYEAYVAKMERRATRVYEIFTIRTLLDHWQDQAREEIDRTAVARRHLVRKRAFEGWHAQHVEDETKVQNFILKNALQTWTQVALHHEVRHEVAAHWHQQQLRKQTLHTMLEETKERQADEFYAVNLAKQCLGTWAEKARDLNDEYQVAVALDERLLLDEAVNIWHEELEVQQYDAYECTRQFLILGCRRDLEYWQEQARLSALLKQYRTKDEQDAKRQALDVWHSAFQNAKSEAGIADAFFLEDPVDHWEREMKLKLFIERDEYETKAAVLNRWALEEKLAWYQRYSETRVKREALDTFVAAARRARTDRERHEQEAAYVDSFYTRAEAVDTWAAETDKMWKHYHNADLVNLYRTTRPCMDHWREQCHQSRARDSYYRRKADRHRARSIVSSVLRKWPDIAETARRQRMMNSLRQFRRKYKVELAQECLGKWLDATAEAVEAGHDAHRANLYYEREDLNDCLDFWAETAKKAQDIQQIAADAELEVYCGKWQAQLHEAQENMADAIEYDAEKTRRQCWEKWEFQTLQQQSKRHMANTLQEKHERRLCGEVLYEWQQQAVPGVAARLNPRLSTVSSRRSVRQQLARSSISRLPTASQLATGLVPFGSLGPMAVFDEESVVPDAMSTPTRRTERYRPTTTPSAILPSPDERALRQRYGGPGLHIVNINEESGEF